MFPEDVNQTLELYYQTGYRLDCINATMKIKSNHSERQKKPINLDGDESLERIRSLKPEYQLKQEMLVLL